MATFAFTAGIKSVGTYTAAGVFTDTQTVVVGGKTYTSQDTLTDSDGNFLVGANAAAGCKNLYDAINFGRSITVEGGGSGTGFAASMTRNKQVFASAVTATTVVVKSNVIGTVGDLVVSTETQSNGSWGAATLASGTGEAGLVTEEISTELTGIGDTAQLNSDVLLDFEDLQRAITGLV